MYSIQGSELHKRPPPDRRGVPRASSPTEPLPLPHPPPPTDPLPHPHPPPTEPLPLPHPLPTDPLPHPHPRPLPKSHTPLRLPRCRSHGGRGTLKSPRPGSKILQRNVATSVGCPELRCVLLFDWYAVKRQRVQSRGDVTAEMREGG